MGNIVSGAITGLFLYLTDIILRQYVQGNGLMEIIKFTLQGMLVIGFINIANQLQDGKGSPSSL